MEPIASNTLPMSRDEVRNKTKGELVHLFTDEFHVSNQQVSKWLFKELKKRSLTKKIPHKVAMLAAKLFPKKALIRIQNENIFFDVPQMLLTTTSGYFKAACQSNWSTSNTFTFDGCPDSLLERLYHYFTTDKPPGVTEDLLHLFAIAYEYQIVDLIDYCYEKLAEFVGGIHFQRNEDGKIVVEIENISDAFKYYFPLIHDTRINPLSFVSCFKILGKAFENNQDFILELVKMHPQTSIALALDTSSTLTAIPFILQCGEELTKRIRSIKLETITIPSGICENRSIRSLIDLFSHCNEVRSCHYHAPNIQSDEIIKCIITSMPHLYELTIESQMNHVALTCIPRNSLLKELHICSNLDKLPDEIANAAELHILSLSGYQSNFDEIMPKILNISTLEKLEIKTPLSKQCMICLTQEFSPMKKLSISVRDFSDEVYDILSRSYLVELELRDCQALSDTHLKMLSRIHTLKSFSIHNAHNITNSGLSHFINALSLQKLSLKDCPQISCDAFMHVHFVKKLKFKNMKLTRLENMHAKYLYIKDCMRLTNLALNTLHSSAVKYFEIKKCPITSKGVLQAIQQLPHLERLVFYPVSDDTLSITTLRPKIVVKNKESMKIPNPV